MSSTEEQKPGAGTDGPDSMQRLEIERDGQISFLTYSVSDEHRLTIWHTKVPEALRGKGVGGELVEQAFALANKKGLTLEPVCPFARDYLSRHPKPA